MESPNAVAHDVTRCAGRSVAMGDDRRASTRSPPMREDWRGLHATEEGSHRSAMGGGATRGGSVGGVSPSRARQTIATPARGHSRGAPPKIGATDHARARRVRRATWPRGDIDHGEDGAGRVRASKPDRARDRRSRPLARALRSRARRIDLALPRQRAPGSRAMAGDPWRVAVRSKSPHRAPAGESVAPLRPAGARLRRSQLAGARVEDEFAASRPRRKARSVR